MTSRFAIAKEKAVGDLEALIPELLGANASPRNRRSGGWNVCNPNRAGSKPAQMIVWLRGARRGGWKDFVCGDQGDAIDLVAYVNDGIVHAESRIRAVAWLEDRFGLRKLDEGARAELARKAEERRARMEAEEADRRQGNRDRARRMFYAAESQILSTPVETYLEARGIPLDDVPHRSSALRFQPECQYWMGAPIDGEGNRIGRAPTFPAMVSAMVSADGTLNACHLTFLEPNGSRKLDTQRRGYLDDDGRGLSAKLMWPDVTGFVVPVTNGPTGLSLAEAAKAGQAGPAAVTEGIEDALSVAVSAPELRTLAAGSLPGLLSLPDIPAVSAWIVFKDNDWGKPQAARLFERSIHRLRQFGKPVEVVSMPADWGKDVNDAINA